jgi:hypothetical protein
LNTQRKKKRFDVLAFFWAFLAAIAFFGMIYLFVLEFDFFSLYLDMGAMLLRAIIIGGSVGLIIGVVASLNVERPFDRVRISLLMLLLGLILGPISLSLSNRKLDKNPTENYEVKLLSVKPYLDSAYGIIQGQERKIKYYEIVFLKDDVTYTSYPPFLPEGADLGASIRLPIRKGYWGYAWLDLIK